MLQQPLPQGAVALKRQPRPPDHTFGQLVDRLHQFNVTVSNTAGGERILCPVEQSRDIQNLYPGNVFFQGRSEPLYKLLRTGNIPVVGHSGISRITAAFDPLADSNPSGGYRQPKQHFHIYNLRELSGPLPFHIP
ncbi:hypothetical protein D3C75_867480 [compost metagenome]